MPKKKPKPKRLPSLSLLARKGFQAEMDKLKSLSTGMKTAVMDSLNAAANPSAENPLVVISTLDREERDIVEQSSPGYMQTFSSLEMRGKLGLMMMTDEEWNALTNDD